MLRIALVASAALLAPSCQNDRALETQRQDPSDVYSVTETNGGELEFGFNFSDGGTVQFSPNAEYVTGLSDDYSIYPASQVMSSSAIRWPDGRGTLVEMESSDSLEEIADYYRRQAEAARIDLQTTVEGSQGIAMSGQSKVGDYLGLILQHAGDSTRVQLLVDQNSGH